MGAKRYFFFSKEWALVGVVITWDSNATTTIIVTALEAMRPMNRFLNPDLSLRKKSIV